MTAPTQPPAGARETGDYFVRKPGEDWRVARWSAGEGFEPPDIGGWFLPGEYSYRRDAHFSEIDERRIERPTTPPAASSAPAVDDMDQMVRISKLIADMQAIKDRYGDTCVYIRRGGLSWGAVALNRRGDDEKHGVFDLQAQHDRDMQQRVEQVRRLMADRDGEREARMKAEKALAAKDQAMGVLFDRLQAAGVDCSDLVP